MKEMVYGTTKINGSKAIWNKGFSVQDSTKKHSLLKSINLGMPQGSVLEPLMFIINMNEIGSGIKECEHYLFADDTLWSVPSTRPREVES
jgi:hypothetical protein